ncbi:Leucine-rich repeat receptor-like protein kinase family [Melia azedarach]|uniref:Leucine-rich repeat receptor-like protein kinase family n=1 Tax=Melia azedarach TaxID=155640 RepID=A0ACC1XZA8_MELAZ|nr:Leucine-rich repeat receptor-like protein kinase family [Melia azedarach]
MESISTFHFKRLNDYTFIIFFLPCFLCQDCPSPSPSIPLVPEVLTFLDQRLAVVYPIIQTFKNTITSDPFNITSTWIGSDICNYIGFYCDHPPDNDTAIALASIDFNGFELSAPTLDGFIDQLPDLALFHANSNKFSGTISPKLAELPYLYELDVSNNRFSGTFPVAILGMKDLSFLDIRYNFFSGRVPHQVFMQRLDVLFLNNNNFVQKLPENLGSTPAIYLTFANNKFTGSIPRSIGDLSSTLTEVLFLNNLLTGCLPYELGFLREARVFDASNNLLTGPLPCSLGCLEKIEQINLAGNLLYGQVPEVLCALGNLVNLTLSNNFFTRVGPLCRKLIKSGVLDVRRNCIHYLPKQRSVHECLMFFLHPRFCPRPLSYNMIPCSVTPWRHNPRTSWKRNSSAYDALMRHRLL